MALSLEHGVAAGVASCCNTWSRFTRVTEDLLVLQHANARIEELLAELRAALHDGLPLRHKMELVEEMARQFDLAGEHDAGRRFRAWCDSMVILRDREE